MTSGSLSRARSAGARSLAALRRPDEVPELDRERLDIGQARDEDVAFANREAFAEGAVLGRTIDTFVVDPQLFAWLHVVEYHHLLRAYHGELPFLVGIEPR